jgi:putative Holliday junction resolvase
VRVLALDYGSARCGAAVSDPTGTLATPLEPVLQAGTRKGLRRVAELVDELGAERVRGAVSVPVELYDERFTTSLARQSGGEATLDSRAAAVLLDEWLNVEPGSADRGGKE